MRMGRLMFCLFVFKQKTAYEMRISDWSSDVCSCDLNSDGEEVEFHRVRFPVARGMTQALVGERLDTSPALQRETTHFWNWLGEEPNGIAKSTGRMARSEERRVGKECVSTGRASWSRYH